MNDMKRELILRELLSDDIIAQQNPHDVAGAYNTMIQTFLADRSDDYIELC